MSLIKEENILSKLINLTLSRLCAIAIAVIISLSLFSIPVNAAPITDLDNGAEIFKANCAACHKNGGNIVRRGKNLKLKTLHKRQVDTESAISTLVTNGKGIMSAYGDKLTPEEIANVSAYVLQRAEQNWK